MRGLSWWSSAVTQVVHWLAAAKNNYIDTVQMSSDDPKFVEFPEVFWPFICSKQFSTLSCFASLQPYLSRLHPPQWCCCCLMIPGDQRQTVSLGSNITAHTSVLSTHGDTHPKRGKDNCFTQPEHRPAGGIFLCCHVKSSQNKNWLQSTYDIQAT